MIDDAILLELYNRAIVACRRLNDTAGEAEVHATTDPCATVASITGRRRRGSIVRGCCTACGWTDRHEGVTR